MKKLLFILFAFACVAKAQISPGDLTKAHSHLEGMSNCTKCHEIGETVTDLKCLACHTEIEELITVKRGYHSSPEVANKHCFECHSEHHGLNFEISRFDRDNFTHSKTGFELKGKHAELKCDQCHKSDLIKNQELKKRAETFLGLGTECKDCHEDYHQKTLGENCESCHNNLKFKPAALFNHDNARFKLQGAHVKVECIGCHKMEKRNGKDFQVFKEIHFASCVSCHRDIHEGKFGQDCSKCHSLNSFKQIKNPDTFDHSMTKFELVGKHSAVQCAQCHKTGYKTNLKSGKCVDCHSDYHKGQIVRADDKYDCAECHNEYGFSPAKYSIESHSKTKFELTGSHLATPCTACHKINDDWQFNFGNDKCVLCHENVHGNALSSKFLGDNECERCHSSVTWNSIAFDHKQTKFELTGKHKEINCAKCHKYESEGIVKYVFSDILLHCENCHTDPHFKQFKDGEFTKCERCHSFDNWQPVKFDHAKTRFPLEGAHLRVECKQCHKRNQLPEGIFVKYKYESVGCSVCHGTDKSSSGKEK